MCSGRAPKIRESMSLLQNTQLHKQSRKNQCGTRKRTRMHGGAGAHRYPNYSSKNIRYDMARRGEAGFELSQSTNTKESKLENFVLKVNID